MPISAGLRRALRRAANLVYLVGGQEGSDNNDPDYVCASVKAQAPDVLFVRTVYGGTKAMTEDEDMLPRHSAEVEEDYTARSKRALLFNVLKRTVKGLVGMIYRAEVVTEDMPGSLDEHFENVDLAGHSLTSFARALTLDAMIDGHAWVHVDAPPAPAVEEGRELTRLQQREMDEEAGINRRPYWIEIPKADALNVQWDLVNGRPTLRLFAYRVSSTEPEGDFGEKELDQIRVLRPGTSELFTRVESNWTSDGVVATSLSYIPVVFVPTNETDTFESEPPLLDLAYINVHHYRKLSDHDWASMFASTPMPWFAGVDKTSVEWGSNRAIFMEDPEASAGMLESSGASLEQTRNDLKDDEARMAALGLQMLVRETRAAETAEAKILDKSESDSALATMAGAVERALQQAAEIHADYEGVDMTGMVKLNRDFHEFELSPAQQRIYLEMVELGRLSLETMWAEMVKGGALPEEFEAEAEKTKLDEPPPDPALRLEA